MNQTLSRSFQVQSGSLLSLKGNRVFFSSAQLGRWDEMLSFWREKKRQQLINCFQSTKVTSWNKIRFKREVKKKCHELARFLPALATLFFPSPPRLFASSNAARRLITKLAIVCAAPSWLDHTHNSTQQITNSLKHSLKKAKFICPCKKIFSLIRSFSQSELTKRLTQSRCQINN